MTEPRQNTQEALNTSSSQNALSSSAAGHLALVPTWLPLDVTPSANSAGNGGDGISMGAISSQPSAVFVPSNTAMTGPHSTAVADQANDALFNQHAVEMAGMGGDGGDGNMAIGGIGGGGNNAGSGGAGVFMGSLVSADVAAFAPVNTAVAAGPHSSAVAQQTNNADFLQGATQIAGIGGSGGSNNYAGGIEPHSSAGALNMFTGDNYAGHGGDGVFVGSLVDVNVAIYSPINIAIAAAGGDAEAQQINNVTFDQGATQIAGIGGNGGSFNMASDTIFTGNAESGAGGTGVSDGSMVNVNVGYFEPINMAIPAGGTADAQQIDHVLADQHALQIAGLGGLGGHDNLAGSAHGSLVDDIFGLIHT